MINDYYAVTHFDFNSQNSLNEFDLILKVYSAHSVSKLHLAATYDPRDSVLFHLGKTKKYFALIKNSIPNRIKVTTVHTIPLINRISSIPELEKLSIKSGDLNYIYLSIPPGIPNEIIINEIHHLIYKRKLYPIIVSFDKLRYVLSDTAFETLYKIPDAIYQFDISSLQSEDSRASLKLLIKDRKTVIFGSGQHFDACLYKNIDYYFKQIRISLGDIASAYVLLHNKKLFC